MMNVVERFKSLPVKTRSLLGLGAIVALVLALPLFIWGILNLTYDLRERASSGEPTCTVNPSDYTVTLVHVDSTNPLKLDYEIGVWNNDSEGCLASNYTMEVHPPTGWTGDFYTDSFSLTPGNSYADNHLYMTAPSGFNNWPQTFTVTLLSDIPEHQETKLITYSPSATPPPTVCASVPMTIEITPDTQDGTPGSTKRYQVDVTNNDGSGCGNNHTVSLSASVPTYLGTQSAGWTTNFTTQNFIMGANETFTTYLDVRSPVSSYSLGAHQIIITSSTVNIPQNANSETLVYNLVSQTGGVPNSTATATPNPSGDPNNCNGTCGSHSNCQGGLFCSAGYCRNPLCPNSTSCNCSVATATSSPKPNSTNEVVYLSPKPKVSSTPRVSPSASPIVTPTEEAKSFLGMSSNIKKYTLIALAVIGLLLILTALGNLFKKKDL